MPHPSWVSWTETGWGDRCEVEVGTHDGLDLVVSLMKHMLLSEAMPSWKNLRVEDERK